MTYFQLISDKELLEIRRIWRTGEVEEPDWVDSVPKIYLEEIGELYCPMMIL